MTARSTDFTASDGTTWPLSSGSWTHTTDAATISTPTNVVNTNRGRARVAAATTVSARRAHHADYSGFKENSVEVRATMESQAGTTSVSPYLFLKTAGTGAVADRYGMFLLDGGSEAKSSITINKWSGGGVTNITSMTGSAPANNLPATTYLAFRAIQLGSSVKLQAKAWYGTEPDWLDTDGSVGGADYSCVTVTDSTTGLWDLDGGVGLGELYSTDPTVQTDLFWDAFTATSIDVIIPPLLASGSTLHQPGVYQVIAPPLLASGSAVYTPGVVQYVDVPLLDSASVVYAPSAASETVVVVPLLASASTIHSPAAALISSSKGTVTATDALAGTVGASDARASGAVGAADAGVGTMSVTDT